MLHVITARGGLKYLHRIPFPMNAPACDGLHADRQHGPTNSACGDRSLLLINSINELINYYIPLFKFNNLYMTN